MASRSNPAIRDKCFHPSGKFIEFPLEDVETSVCARFEKMVAQYPDNWAIVTDSESLTYAELNERANRVAYSIIDQRGIGTVQAQIGGTGHAIAQREVSRHVREAQRGRPGDALGLHLQAPQQPRHQEERERLTRVLTGRLRCALFQLHMEVAA